MTDPTLALDMSVDEPNDQECSADLTMRSRARYRRRPRLLVIGRNSHEVNEVLDLLNDDRIDVLCETAFSPEQGAFGVDPPAEVIVLVGPAPAHAVALMDPEGAPSRPLVWLPEPGHACNRAHSLSEWRRTASFALRAALLPWLDHEPKPTAQSRIESELELDAGTGELRQGARTVRMTPTECSLLRVMLAQRGRWIPALALKQQAFGSNHRSHDSLIRVHIYKLRRKLESLPAHIHSAKGRGYMLA